MNFVGSIGAFIYSYIIVLEVLREGLVAGLCEDDIKAINENFYKEVSKTKSFYQKLFKKCVFFKHFYFFLTASS